MDDEEDQEEENHKAHVQSRVVEEIKDRKEFHSRDMEDEDGDEEEDDEEELEEDEDAIEEEVEVPDKPPEDSWFIPLGIARQRPQAFYKGSDPEWQSFVEFSRDKKRGMFIRSRSILYFVKHCTMILIYS